MIALVVCAVMSDCRTDVCAVDPYCCNVQWDVVCQIRVTEICPCAFDLDGDGSVDGADLGILLSNWNQESPQCDLNMNGIVDGADISLLLAAWKRCN